MLGRVPTDTTLRRELAAAARSRGTVTALNKDIVELRTRISEIDVPEVDLRAARKRFAEASGEEERLRERVASARGSVQARREVGADTADSVAELERAAADLSVVETERIAAEQALANARTGIDDARDARERRLRLCDRLRNRRRTARDQLAREIYPTFRDALTVIPNGDPADAGADPSAYDGQVLAASLAAVRIASLPARVVLSGPAIESVVATGPSSGSGPTEIVDIAEDVLDCETVVLDR